MNKENEIEVTRLRAMVEQTIGREVRTPRDFDFLQRQLQELTHQTLSMSTLKRAWNYTSREFALSRYTLDVLSKLVGYANWESFCMGCKMDESGENTETPSHVVVVRRLSVRALDQGERLVLHWQPNRTLEVVYEGLDLFTVLRSENSKLQVGDKFQTTMFVDHQPLLLYCVQRQGMPPFDYRCGNQGGIVWKLIAAEEELR